MNMPGGGAAGRAAGAPAAPPEAGGAWPCAGGAGVAVSSCARDTGARIPASNTSTAKQADFIRHSPGVSRSILLLCDAPSPSCVSLFCGAARGYIPIAQTYASEHESADRPKRQPPAMAPMIMRGSLPAATDSGSGLLGDSCEMSSWQAKKRRKGGGG